MDDFRLIANPYLLSNQDKNKKTTIETYESQLNKIIELEYNIYIHPQLSKTITKIIDNEINDYKINKYVHEFIDACIQKAVENLI
jgi:hypothetical protein